MTISAGTNPSADSSANASLRARKASIRLAFSAGSTVHVLSDYAMAAMFAVFVVGCAHSRLKIEGKLAEGIRRAATYTFTFYLLHFTLFVFCNALGWRQVGGWHFRFLAARGLSVSRGACRAGACFPFRVRGRSPCRAAAHPR